MKALFRLVDVYGEPWCMMSIPRKMVLEMTDFPAKETAA